MTKTDNIKNYYIQKRINKNILKAKLNVLNIKFNKENTLQNKIWENLISRVNSAYTSKNIQRIIPYKKLIGCNEIELYNHLENLLHINLKMEDYPLWEVDHIKGIINYNLNIESEQLECFNYKNLQPLLIHDNRSKKKFIMK